MRAIPIPPPGHSTLLEYLRQWKAVLKQGWIPSRGCKYHCSKCRMQYGLLNLQAHKCQNSCVCLQSLTADYSSFRAQNEFCSFVFTILIFSQALWQGRVTDKRVYLWSTTGYLHTHRHEMKDHLGLGRCLRGWKTHAIQVWGRVQIPWTCIKPGMAPPPKIGREVTQEYSWMLEGQLACSIQLW